MVKVVGLLALTWAAQLFVLHRAEGYSAWARFRAPALLKGEGTRASTVPPEELRFLRCLGERLPRALPVSSFGDLHPVFHLQSVVFEARLERARHAPRLRVVPASIDPAPPVEGFCLGPRVGGLEVQAECDLVPLVEGCRQDARDPPR